MICEVCEVCGKEIPPKCIRRKFRGKIFCIYCGMHGKEISHEVRKEMSGEEYINALKKIVSERQIKNGRKIQRGRRFLRGSD